MRLARIALALLVLVSLLSLGGFAGETKKVKLDVNGMMCGSCESKVKASLEKVEGVKSADVDWNKGVALVMAKSDVKNEDLVKAVKSAGPKFNAKVAEDKEKK